jgi:hypothetical protein
MGSEGSAVSSCGRTRGSGLMSSRARKLSERFALATAFRPGPYGRSRSPLSWRPALRPGSRLRARVPARRREVVGTVQTRACRSPRASLSIDAAQSALKIALPDQTHAPILAPTYGCGNGHNYVSAALSAGVSVVSGRDTSGSQVQTAGGSLAGNEHSLISSTDEPPPGAPGGAGWLGLAPRSPTE